MSDTNYHSSRSSVTKQGKQSFQFLAVVVQKECIFSPVVGSSRARFSGVDPDLAG